MHATYYPQIRQKIAVARNFRKIQALYQHETMSTKRTCTIFLVGGFNPFQKQHLSNWIISSGIGVKSPPNSGIFEDSKVKTEDEMT